MHPCSNSSNSARVPRQGQDALQHLELVLGRPLMAVTFAATTQILCSAPLKQPHLILLRQFQALLHCELAAIGP